VTLEWLGVFIGVFPAKLTSRVFVLGQVLCLYAEGIVNSGVSNLGAYRTLARKMVIPRSTLSNQFW
jgi:hypothetical protein